jgi:hypothetical protein
MHLKVAILYIIIVILLFIIYKYLYSEGFQSNSPDVEIVIANYEEDINWVNDIPSNMYNRISIYNKGKPKNYASLIKKGAKIHTLPNIGRESHTYLYHIIQNYDNLADVTIFLPGSTMTFNQKKEQLDIIFDVLQTKKDSIIIGFKDPVYLQNELDTFMIDEYEITSEENKKNNPGNVLEPARIRPFGKWVKARFPGKSFKCMTYRGVFAVSRRDIHKQSRRYYEKFIEELQFKNAEVVHYFERAWSLVFSIDDKKCKTAYYNLNAK